MKRINALTIAGTDPSGGAGIQADLKTFSALGAYGCSAITALVAQNTRGVQSVYRIEPDFVAAQLDSVFSDVRIDTTKIGMLAETDIVEAVAERLARYRVANVVLDTVMLAKSGDPLLSASAVETLRQRLLPQVSLITPNLPEAAALLDAPMRAARNAGAGAGAAGAGLRRGINEGRPSRRCRKPGLALHPRRGTAVYRAASADQKHPRHRLYALRRAGGAAPASRGLGGHRYRGEGLAVGGPGAGRLSGGGPRHRAGAPFPRLVVNGSATGQQNLLKKWPPAGK
jgi:hydroxymethylpyrimidine/phosphomethylpyrimidine kinase